jgi:hypothetical protein
MARPSHKELNGKLKAALKSVHANRIVLLEPAVLVADAVELGYSIRDELQIVLIDLLNSSSPEEYVGCRPPEKSYETKILDLELWAFSVAIPRFHPRIYFKFSLCGDTFYLVSLHVCRSQGE